MIIHLLVTDAELDVVDVELFLDGWVVKELDNSSGVLTLLVGSSHNRESSVAGGVALGIDVVHGGVGLVEDLVQFLSLGVAKAAAVVHAAAGSKLGVELVRKESVVVKELVVVEGLFKGASGVTLVGSGTGVSQDESFEVGLGVPEGALVLVKDLHCQVGCGDSRVA